MPASPPQIDSVVRARLTDAGQVIRARRKALGITVVAAAESARMSRVTWHRIEKGASNVTVAAYASALATLGLEWRIDPRATLESRPDDLAGGLPAEIRLADYPQLQRLAWHVRGISALSPREAWDIYQRNARHLDTAALGEGERVLRDALERAFGTGGAHV